MSCFFCKNKMITTTTTRLIEFGESIIIIKNVPCHKCGQCGEATINIVVSERLEQIINEFNNTLMEVTIIKYSESAA